MAQSRHFTDTFTQQEAAIRISTKLQINRIQRAEEKLPDNKHFVIRICIQPGVLKSNCPEKKKCYSEYQNAFHWAWTCISGLECKWTKVCITSSSFLDRITWTKTCSCHTSSTRQRGDCSVGFQYILEITTATPNHTDNAECCITSVSNTYWKLSVGKRKRKRSRKRKQSGQAPRIIY